MGRVWGSLLLLAGSLLVGLVGCGRSYCERNARAIEDCGVDADMWLEQCREDLKSCTRADEKRLEALFDCREDVGIYACDPDPDALESGLACLRELDGKSEACVVDEAILSPSE